jgi:DNA polymerase III subunit gamma/tau
MSYQVLARKYRPSNFQELEGQEHVLRALMNALEQNRLHHAYLFTGTRGVGKTTIARILAKCFNCETGVTATPCGKCGTCLEIAEGRSVDLIEVDAASRTRVEDTRELLDNVQYMPSRDRFKVYLIDEVHMLSNHSFNALLKTLEEPPAHVKFLLATTDPKKLPVTVLSRCLQFNLKRLSPERIVNYLKRILDLEQISFEENALWQLGRAADGSMRDALSLTDQAISFGGNRLVDTDVRAMLGAIDHREVHALLDALVARDAKKLLDCVAALAEFAPDYEMLLGQLLRVLHRVAVAQAVPGGVDNAEGDREFVLTLAKVLRPEDVQLFYQIGLIGQRDLPVAPDPRDGFEMVMLRMLSFIPEHLQSDEAPVPSAVAPTPTPTVPRSARAADTGADKPRPGKSPVADLLTTINGSVTKPVASVASKPVTEDMTSVDIPWDDTDGIKPSAKVVESGRAPPAPVPDPVPAVAAPKESPHKAAATASAEEWLTPEGWIEIFASLDIAGVTRTLAANCVLHSVEGSHCTLMLNEQHASLWNKTHEIRIADALTKRFGREVTLQIEVKSTSQETPADRFERQSKERLDQAISSIKGDENIKQLIETFDAKLDVRSIMPRTQTGD